MGRYRTEAHEINIGGMRFEQFVEYHDGWDMLERTTNSGKALFRCRSCGRESIHPDKYCPMGPARKIAGPDKVEFSRR